MDFCFPKYTAVNSKLMKLIKNTVTVTFHEIEIEYNLIFFKHRVKYRLIGDQVYRYKHPNIYSEIGLSEHIRVRPLFSAFVS